MNTPGISEHRTHRRCGTRNCKPSWERDPACSPTPPARPSRCPLTGLPNRTLRLELLDHALQRDHRTEKSTAVLFLDLDDFKAINDTYGHGVGDQLLVAVARRLRHLLRTTD